MRKVFSSLLACAMAVSVTACASTSIPVATTAAQTEQAEETTEAPVQDAKYKAGTYTGKAAGKNGDITVEVTVSDDAITEVKVTDHQETAGISDPAISDIPDAIVKNQSLGIDAVSGATITSNAILTAVEAALTEAGADIDALKNVEVTAKEAGEDIEETADVVVVGAGGAGLAAAAAAEQAGASVIVLEKMPTIGGNSALGEGTYNVADPEMLELTGAKTTPDLEKEVEDALAETPKNDDHKALIEKVKKDFDEWKASGTDTLFDSANWHALQTYIGGGEIGDVPLIETYATGAVDAYKWLTEDIGVPFKTDYIFMAVGGKWQRGHQIDLEKAEGKEGDNGGRIYTNMLQETAEKLGAKIYTDADVKEILKDDSGRATGAVAERSDGSKITVHANKGVVLATGGFAANSDLVNKYSNGVITTTRTSCAASSTGDGIALAEALGANFVDLDQIQVHPLGDPVDGCVAEFVGNWLGAQYYVYVNKEGQRFVKEDGTRYEMSMAELQQTDGEMYLIVDSSQITDDRQDQIDSLIEKGRTVKADTIEELAEKIDVDPTTLKETIDKYNEGMKNGKDEFGKATSAESTIEKAPFYASIRTTTVHHTMGGVQIDSDAHVINKDGDVIPGLYAAGEFTGGIHGNNRLGGNAYPDIITFGRIAGTNVAAE